MASGLALALVALAGETRATSCFGGPFVWRKARMQAVFIGVYSDLLGHRAAFFYAPQTRRLIGPLDLVRHPRAARKTPRPGRLSRRLRLGARGRLTFWRLTSPGRTRLSATAGYFARFRRRGRPMEGAALLRAIKAPFVVGLLAGKSAVQQGAAKRLAALSKGNSRARLVRGGQGVIYSAPAARARQLLSSLRYRDLANTWPLTIVALHRQGLAGLARLATGKLRYAWTDYLPPLAAAWTKGKRRLRPLVEQLVLGHSTPRAPRLKARRFRPRMKCPPYRHQRRGPFQGPRELSARTLLQRLQQHDRRFVRAMVRAFAGLSAVPRALVLQKRRIGKAWHVLLGNSSDDWAVVEVPRALARRLAVGAALDLIARGKPGPASGWFAHLAPREITVSHAGKIGRFRLHRGRHGPALLRALKSAMMSGALSYRAGFALQALYQLAKRRTPRGWDRAAFRKLLRSLPGNSYWRFWRWSQAWAAILEKALLFSGDPAFADEIDRELPRLVRAAARRSKGKTVRGAALFNFVARPAVRSALLRLRRRDHRGARRVLARAAGDLKKMLPAGITVPRWRPSSYQEHLLRPLRVLTEVLAGKRGAARRMVPRQRSKRHDDAVGFGNVARDYAPALQKRWRAALRRAGYAFKTP